jgi:hypothetical protein
MDGLNLPRHIEDRFERRWAQKLKALAPASAKPSSLADRNRPVGHRRKRPKVTKRQRPKDMAGGGKVFRES